MIFHDRFEAGSQLADILYPPYKYQKVKVFAIPNGGLPVGYEIAKRFGVPLEVIVSRKLQAPGSKTFGLGAVSEEGAVVIDDVSLRMFSVNEKALWEILQLEKKHMEERVKLFRHNALLSAVETSLAIVVDDGLANYTVAQAALETITHHNPSFLIFAAPVCEIDVSSRIGEKVDDIVCLNNSDEVGAITIWYEDYEEVTDELGLQLIKKSYKYAQEHAGFDL